MAETVNLKLTETWQLAYTTAQNQVQMMQVESGGCYMHLKDTAGAPAVSDVPAFQLGAGDSLAKVGLTNQVAGTHVWVRSAGGGATLVVYSTA